MHRHIVEVVSNLLQKQRSLGSFLLFTETRFLPPFPYHRAIQNKIFEQSKVRCSQTSDGVPTLDSLESTRPAPGIVPANDIVQTIESFGVQPRIEEPKTGKPRGYTGVIQEGDHTGECLINGIKFDENVKCMK